MPRPAVALVFSKVGSVDVLGGAEELADALEAIEIPLVLWQEARCAGAEDSAAAVQGFATVGSGAS